MNIAAIPLDMVLADTRANLDLIESRIGSLPAGTDFVVLPEMCTTGYTLDPLTVESYVETVDGPSVTRLRDISTRRGIAIAGTFACKDGGRFYNRGFMLLPDGTALFYDKRHLFILGREPMLYTPGQELPPVVEYKGIRIMIVVCYDLRFPAWCRYTSERPYDLLIVPANWPDARAFAWRQLLIARAIENQAYIVGCNRLGSDPYGEYHTGITHIFNHWGDDIADRTTPGIIQATIDPELLARDRRRFPNLEAADDLRIIL